MHGEGDCCQWLSRTVPNLHHIGLVSGLTVAPSGAESGLVMLWPSKARHTMDLSTQIDQLHRVYLVQCLNGRDYVECLWLVHGEKHCCDLHAYVHVWIVGSAPLQKSRMKVSITFMLFL